MLLLESLPKQWNHPAQRTHPEDALELGGLYDPGLRTALPVRHCLYILLHATKEMACR